MGPTSFDLNDAKRDPVSGEFATEEVVDATAAILQSDGEGELEMEENSEHESGGETTDEELDGDDFLCSADFEVHKKCPPENSIIGGKMFHRYDVGWFLGEVRRKVAHSTIDSHNGKFAVKYPDRAQDQFQPLLATDYSPKGHWVLVKAK